VLLTSVLEAACIHRLSGEGTIPSAAGRITALEQGRHSAAPGRIAKALYLYCVLEGATATLMASPTARALLLVPPATSAPPAQ